MIDSHCHLDCDLFDADRPAVLERAARAGVTDVVVPAVGVESWERIAALATRTDAPRCHAALGLHPVSLPERAESADAADLGVLAERLARTRVVAVGECGLDDTLELTRAPYERQERVLRAQLALADRARLSVILHARGAHAYRRLAELLEEHGPLVNGGVLHSYGGGAHLVPRLAALGLYFGFAGPATYPGARKVRASIAAVAAERLLAETDAPDQTPEPYRPGRSEPAYVASVVAGLAKATGRSPHEMAALTSANAMRLFHLGPR